MAEFSNPADPARLSRRALQTRALAAARDGQLSPRPKRGGSGAEDEAWVEQPAARVRWTFEGRLAWMVASIMGAVLIAALLWAFSGMPKAQPNTGGLPLANPISDAGATPTPGSTQPADPVPGGPLAPEPLRTEPLRTEPLRSWDEQETEPVVVHVAGAVAQAGVVELPAGSRVSDAVAAAGGVTDEADLSRINLASWVADGERVYVLSRGETEIPSLPATGSGTLGEGGTPQPPSGDGESALINLNAADSTQLQLLSGIGPALAQRIIEHREQFGPFAGLHDLGAVSGIGPVMLSKLEGRVTW